MLDVEITQDDYYGGKFEIAREGYWDYDTEGYVALVKEGKAAIVHASHCSCYGTWDSVDTPPFDWTGTVEELVKLAASKGDPDGLLPRPLDPEKDYGARYLLTLYEKIVEWDKNGRK